MQIYIISTLLYVAAVAVAYEKETKYSWVYIYLDLHVDPEWQKIDSLKLNFNTTYRDNQTDVEIHCFSSRRQGSEVLW